MNNAELVLVFGIANVLMGDEGIGVEVVRRPKSMSLPASVQRLDGGTGSILLLEPMQRAHRVILIPSCRRLPALDCVAVGRGRRFRRP